MILLLEASLVVLQIPISIALPNLDVISLIIQTNPYLYFQNKSQS